MTTHRGDAQSSNATDEPDPPTPLEALRDKPLADFGGRFLPVEPRKKGPRQARTDDTLLKPDNPILRAHLEAGHGYAIAMHGDLAALDADDLDVFREHGTPDALPETAWQWSGSRESQHYLLRVPELDRDITLYHPEALPNPDGEDTIGHVKAAPQSIIIGPGSIHPSGNRYGPLHGDEIATTLEATVRDLVDPFTPDDNRKQSDGEQAPSATQAVSSRDRCDGGADIPIDVYDVLSPASYPEETRVAHPYHGSNTGANFIVDSGGETFRCWRHEATGNALHLVGIEQGVIDCGEWTPTGLDRETWAAIFEAAREAGYDLPAPADARSPVPLLPDLDTDPWVTGEWGGLRPDETAASPTVDEEDGEDEDGLLSPGEVYDRVRRIARTALRAHNGRVLLDGLPSVGKTTNTIAAIAEVADCRGGELRVTFVTPRGHEEQYERVEQLCENHGLSSFLLPNFPDTCDTYVGEHGDGPQEQVQKWYRAGATPKQIHRDGEPPCTSNCTYKSAWDFDPDEYDVLIGHPTHLYHEGVTQGRTVVVDEFPAGAFETAFGTPTMEEPPLAPVVSAYLQDTPALPFAHYDDLLDADDEARADALAWFLSEETRLQRDPEQALQATGYDRHALAPRLIFTLLAADKVDDRWRRATFPDGGVGLHDRTAGVVYLLRPPSFEYANGVLALDGTPTPWMWERTLGTWLDHRQVLTDMERTEYLRDVVKLQIVQTSEDARPYSSGEYVTPIRDAAILVETGSQYDTPGLITARRALNQYEADESIDLDALTDGTAYYGNLLGSNQFEDATVGAVIGSPHRGDDFVERWAAYAGEATEREGYGMETTFTGVGDDVLRHMREHQVLQAILRFARDDSGTVVVVDTGALPEWVPIAARGTVVWTASDGLRDVVTALRDLQEHNAVATTSTIADHEAVTIGSQQIRDHLNTLADRGVVRKEPHPMDGRKNMWVPTDFNAHNPYGAVTLDHEGNE